MIIPIVCCASFALGIACWLYANCGEPAAIRGRRLRRSRAFQQLARYLFQLLARFNQIRIGFRILHQCRGGTHRGHQVIQNFARRLGILPEGGPRDMKGPSTMQ